MEVHPPEHGIHNWRDFFVHMATICLGLLIAIGLEQTLEWAHRRQELHVLRNDLLMEAKSNARRAQAGYWDRQIGMRWEGERLNQLRETLVKGIPIPEASFVPREQDLGDPENPVWSSAKASGLLAILPQEENLAYSRIDADLATLRQAEEDDVVAGMKQAAAEGVNCEAPCKSNELARATVPQREEQIRLMGEQRFHILRETLLLQEIYGLETSIAQGAYDLHALETAEKQPVPRG